MYRKPKVIGKHRVTREVTLNQEPNVVMHSGTPKVEYQGCQSNNKYTGGPSEACLMILSGSKNCQISCTVFSFIPHELRFYLQPCLCAQGTHRIIFLFKKTKDTLIFFYNIGIISLKFPLSSQPVLGDWKIEALFQVCLHLCV